MGNWNSGRRPTPTKLKILRGNPGRRRLNAREPAPPPADASFELPPPELTGDALALVEWARVVPMLRACGVISQVERSALVALCQQWSQYLEAQLKVRELGMIVKTKDGGPITNPYLTVAGHALRHCQRLWVELGLTPSGRSKMAALPTLEHAPEVAARWPGLV